MSTACFPRSRRSSSRWKALSTTSPIRARCWGGRAAAEGREIHEYVYDFLLKNEGESFAIVLGSNYSAFNHDVIHTMLTDPNTVTGLSDAGAHVNLIFDAVAPTYQLTHWVRDRDRGARLPLEFVVQKQSLNNAELYGLADRGSLEVGKRADLNLIDFDNLALGDLEVRRDLPAGGSRILQNAKGYIATFVKGVRTPRPRQGYRGSARTIGARPRLSSSVKRILAMSQNEAAWSLPDPFVIEFDVADSEIDRLGHVNNAVYMEWCQRTAWAHTRALGLDWESWERLDAAMIVHRARLDYKLPAMPGDRVASGTWLISNDSKVRATRRFEVYRGHDGKALFQAEMDFVCAKITVGRPRRMPPEFISAYAVLPSVEAALREGEPPKR